MILLSNIPLGLGEGLGDDVGEALGASVPTGPSFTKSIEFASFSWQF